MAKQRAPDAFAPHADFVQRAHKSLRDTREKWLAANGDPIPPPVTLIRNDEKSNLAGREQDTSRDRKRGNKEREGGRDGEVDEGVLDEGAESDRGETRPDPARGVRTDSPENYEDPESRPSKRDTSDSQGRKRERRLDDDQEENELDDQDRNIQEDYKRVDAAAEKAQRERRAGGGEGKDEKNSKKDLELDLLRQLLERTIQLEAEARQMLLDSMDKGIARMLLLADRNGA